MTTKITVSLPNDLVAAAKEAVTAGRAPSVSAFVADALASKVQRDSLSALVADIIAEDGEPAPDDYAWADRL